MSHSLISIRSRLFPSQAASPCNTKMAVLSGLKKDLLLGWLSEGEAQVFQGGISPGADDAHLLAAQLLSQVVGCGKGGCPRRLCKGVGSFDQPQLCPQDLFVGE